LPTGAVGGRGGEGDSAHARVALGQHAELDVLGPEVVAPLRDAVGLVYREEVEAPARVEAVEEREEAVGEEPLGRDVEQVEPALGGVALDGARLGELEAAVEERRAHAL